MGYVHNDCAGKKANCVLIDIDVTRRGDVDIYFFINEEKKNDPYYDFDDGFTTGGEFFRIFATGVLIDEVDKEDIASSIDDCSREYDIYDDFLDEDYADDRDGLYNCIISKLYHYRDGSDGPQCKSAPIRHGATSPTPKPQ